MENQNLLEIQKLNALFSQKERDLIDKSSSLTQLLEAQKLEFDLAQTELQKLKEQESELIAHKQESETELLKLRESSEEQVLNIENKHKESLVHLATEYTVNEQNYLIQIENIRNELKEQTNLSAEHLAALAQREKEFANELSKLRENESIYRTRLESQYQEKIQEISQEHKTRESHLTSQIENIRNELKEQTNLSAEHLAALAQREKEFANELSKLRENESIHRTGLESQYQEKIQEISEEHKTRESHLTSQIENIRNDLKEQTNLSAEHLATLAQREKECNGREQSFSSLITQIQDLKYNEAKKHLESLAQREKEFANELSKLRESESIYRTTLESQYQEKIQKISDEYKTRESHLTSQIENIRNELKEQTNLSAEHLATLAQREKEFANELSKLRESESIYRTTLESQYQEKIQKISDEYKTRESHLTSQIENIRNELKEQTNLSAEHLATLAQREKEFANELKQISDEKYIIELKNSDLSHLLTSAQQLQSQLYSELVERQQMLNSLGNELGALKGSFSWRISVPLRAIGTLFTSSHADYKEVSMSSMEDTKKIVAPTTDEPLATREDYHVSPNVIDSFANTTVKEPLISQPEQPIIHIKETFMSSSPIVAATSLDELLAYHDADFVYCAYITLLGRVPDPDGLRYYLGRLRAGRSKIAIIDQIVSSVEGKEYSANVTDLEQELAQYRWTKIPIIGGLMRSISREDELVRQMYAVQSSVYRLDKDINSRLDGVEKYIFAILNHNDQKKPILQSENDKLLTVDDLLIIAGEII